MFEAWFDSGDLTTDQRRVRVASVSGTGWNQVIDAAKKAEKQAGYRGGRYAYTTLQMHCGNGERTSDNQIILGRCKTSKSGVVTCKIEPSFGSRTTLAGRRSRTWPARR